MAGHLSSPSLRSLRNNRLALENEVSSGRLQERSAWAFQGRHAGHGNLARNVSEERQNLEVQVEHIRHSEAKRWRQVMPLAAECHLVWP